MPKTKRTSIACILSILPKLVGMLAVFLPALSLADRPSFEQILASTDVATLTDWGKRYEHGKNVPQDIDQAIRLFCKAAGEGDASSQYSLGWIYALGRAGKKDEVLAASWLGLAAKQDHEQAKTMLANLGAAHIKRRVKPRCVLSDQMVSRTIIRGAKPISKDVIVRVRSKTGKTSRKNPKRKQIETLVRKLAPHYGLSPRLVLAVIEAESNFNSRALSPKNAQGLMQLIPATARRFGVKNAWDPEQNLRGGMAYLRWLLKHFKGDVRLALAGYNAGERAVQRYGGVPPYKETQNYVRRITKNLNYNNAEQLSPYGKAMRRNLRRKGLDLRSDEELRLEYSS